MSIAFTEGELSEDRADAASRFTLTVDIGTYGPWYYDEDAEADVRDVIATLTNIPARLRVRSAQSVRDTQAAERTVTIVERELHIPWDSPAVPADAVAHVTAVGPLDDPTILGADLVLAGPAPGSQTTARRLLVREFVMRAAESEPEEES